MTGICKYCGQIRAVDCDGDETERNEEATMECRCSGAETHRAILAEAEKAKSRINSLFGEDAEMYGMKIIHNEMLTGILRSAVDAMADGRMAAVTVEINPNMKAKVKISGTKISVERTETKKTKLEE